MAHKSPWVSGAHALPGDRFGRDVCGDLEAAERAEWLITNGIGGYASGTLAGPNSRGYHGLLVAALAPPVGRTLMLASVLETLQFDDESYDLATVRWHDGNIAPAGQIWLESVTFEGTLPVWRFAGPRFVIEKRISMDHGANVTRIDYTNVWSDGPVRLSLRALTDFRDYHSRSFASDWVPGITADGAVLRVEGPDGPKSTLTLRLDGADVAQEGVWYRAFDLFQERGRGLTDAEDHVLAGTLARDIGMGETLQLVVSAGADPAATDLGARDRELKRQAGLLDTWAKANPAVADTAPEWVQRLVLAADQFVSRRTMRDGQPGHTIIAGYHWFADWGRDTMISLPGLTLQTGRAELAKSALLSFADVIDGGMVPNRFPDSGEAPEFNTVDAAFWFIDCVASYHRSTGDDAFLKQMFPVLEGMVAALQTGERYNIHMDPDDGLIYAGEDGVQLTWMDAKVGDWVVTPRIGKPIEVNALWLKGLRFIAAQARRLGLPADVYEAMLAKAQAGFARFWNADRGFCYDVLDGPNGNEDLLRPNQIFATLDGVGALSVDQRKAVLRVCERHLVTPAGLRSLGPLEPGYIPHYGGDQYARDSAYHQGTVWGFLIGPFIEAHLDTFGDPVRAAALLAPMADQLRIEGVGTLSEIFEAAAPHAPRGCIAQAWSVGEALRAWHLIAHYKPTA